MWCMVHWGRLSQKEIVFKERKTCTECGLYGHVSVLGLARCGGSQTKHDPVVCILTMRNYNKTKLT